MKRNDLQTIMRRAWTIARTTGKAFNICLVKAWSLYRLTQRMRAGVVRFAYEKADGTLRRAAGTLHEVAATITIPVSNREGIVTVEDLLSEIGRQYKEEMRLSPFWSIGGCIWSSITVCTIQRSTKGRQ